MEAVGGRALLCRKFGAAKRPYELAGGIGALLLLGLAMGDLNSIILGDIKREKGEYCFMPLA